MCSISALILIPAWRGERRLALAGRSILLVMDNCEHVADAAGSVATKLLEGAHELRVLAGSRQPLDLPSETVSPMAPLPLPAGRDLDAVMARPGRTLVRGAGGLDSRQL
jgi:predicted ATPase